MIQFLYQGIYRVNNLTRVYKRLGRQWSIIQSANEYSYKYLAMKINSGVKETIKLFTVLKIPVFSQTDFIIAVLLPI